MSRKCRAICIRQTQAKALSKALSQEDHQVSVPFLSILHGWISPRCCLRPFPTLSLTDRELHELLD